MSRTSTYPLHDRAVGGNLTRILTDLRGEGLSYEDITFRLRTDHGMTVTRSTVRRWCLALGIGVAP